MVVRLLMMTRIGRAEEAAIVLMLMHHCHD